MSSLYFEAYKIRKVEQSLLELFGKGLVGGTIHTCVGQEFTGVCLAPHLKEGDVVVSNHRCHGHYLAIYQDYEGLIAEILGKPNGVNRGFGGSQHIHRKGFYSSGIQGGMLPSAAGMALSMKKRGQNNIAVSFIGDGTLGQGIVYETMNFISKHSLPHLIVIENNRYSQSTSQAETLGGSIQKRVEAFNITYFAGDTQQPEELSHTYQIAVEHLRSGKGPAVIEIETYRLNPHSKGDDLRDPAEIEAAKDRDSLNTFLKNNDLPEQATFNEKVEQIIEKTLSQPNENLIRDFNVTKEEVEEQRLEFEINNETQIKELNSALHEIFQKDSEALLLGEDVKDPYGGTFKASKGLTESYPDRVINMPISEPTIVGTALGSANSDRLTFAEIMFGDFTALAFDQILNHAAKMTQMFGAQITTPLIIRTPMGGGRGYGATHSQCLEKHFVGVPDLDTFMFHPRTRVKNFYLQLAKNRAKPALVFEHKLLYSKPIYQKLPEDYELYESQEQFPYTHLKPEDKPDITVVALGGTGAHLEPLINDVSQEEVALDIFYPLDLNSSMLIKALEQSLAQTQTILFLEEGTENFSISESLLGKINSKLAFKSKILATPAMPLPSSPYLENIVLPNKEKIESALWEIFDESI